MTPGAATTLPELNKKIESRHAQIGIVGMGYVGLPLALLFSGEGFAVTGFDIEERKVKTLNAGSSYIVRILPDAIQKAQKSGFRATSDYSDIDGMDAIIICVPTPLNEYHEPDLSYVIGTIESIAPHLHDGQLVVLESTTYPGTTEEIVVPLIEKGNRHGLKVARNLDDVGIHVAFSPEREDPGNETVARHDIPKVVGGCGPGRLRACGRLLRRHLPARCSGQQSLCCGDDQAARKHLSLRQYRPRERTEAALHAHGNRHPRGDRRGQNQALRLSGVLSGTRPRRPLHPDRSLLSFVEGTGSSTSALALSNSRAKSTSTCPTS